MLIFENFISLMNIAANVMVITEVFISSSCRQVVKKYSIV